MTSLPLEILWHISEYLPAKDLKQLQLVNKEWYEAFAKTLYSTVKLEREDQVVPYIRTISRSPKHALFLKTFHVSNLFCIRFTKTVSTKELDFFGTLIKHCPNLERIRCCNQHFSLWALLIQASNEGKLSNLKELPSVDSANISEYISTALCFKKTLESLILADHIGSAFNFNKINPTAFQKLRQHITEFSNLKKLIIHHHTNQLFSHLDTLIEECPYLTELEVRLFPSVNLDPLIKLNVLALPRPNICRLTCSWSSLGDDDQLMYFIQKFSNIKQLKIILDESHGETSYLISHRISYQAIIEFFRYISHVPNLDIEMASYKFDTLPYWNEFLKLRQRKSSIVKVIFDDMDTVDYIVMKYNSKLLELRFPSYPRDSPLRHEKFFRAHGAMIKNLELRNFEEVYDDDLSWDEEDNQPMSILLSDSKSWLLQILQSCPSLEELKLYNFPNFNFPVNDPFRHTKLEKLNIVNTDREISLKFLHDFSMYVPNLKYLHINSYKYEYVCDKEVDISEEGLYLKIDMPYTSFDHITWLFHGHRYDIIEFHIKLKTITGTKYFVANESGSYEELTYDEYQADDMGLLFDIICHDLNQFIVELVDDSKKLYTLFNIKIKEE